MDGVGTGTALFVLEMLHSQVRAHVRRQTVQADRATNDDIRFLCLFVELLNDLLVEIRLSTQVHIVCFFGNTRLDYQVRAKFAEGTHNVDE